MEGLDPIGMPPMLTFLKEMGGLRADELREAQEAVDEASPVDRSDEQLQQVARDFESVLLTKLFDQVQQAMGDLGLEEEDTAAKQVHGMFWYYLAKDGADKGGIGMWREIYERFQEMGGAPRAGTTIDEGL
jgi:Rod binding domain-containing protein